MWFRVLCYVTWCNAMPCDVLSCDELASVVKMLWSDAMAYEFVMPCGWLRCHVVWFEVAVWCGDLEYDLVIRTTKYFKYFTVLQSTCKYYSSSILYHHVLLQYYKYYFTTIPYYTVQILILRTTNYYPFDSRNRWNPGTPPNIVPATKKRLSWLILVAYEATLYRGGSELKNTSGRSGNHRQHVPAAAHNLPTRPLECRACNRVGGIFHVRTLHCTDLNCSK